MTVSKPRRVLLVASLLWSVSPAEAEPAPATPTQLRAGGSRVTHPVARRSWSTVSAARERRANELLAAGRAHFDAGRYQEALDLFQQALKEWDHPALRFNLAQALMELGRVIEAYDNFGLAMEYGPEALNVRKYAEADRERRRIEAQTAAIEVMCNEPDARVAIDEVPLLAYQGRAERRFLPGVHHAVVTKDGFVTETHDVMVRAGDRVVVSVALARVARRWAAWKPWAVVAGGSAVTGVGGLVAWQARSKADRFDREIRAVCGNDGCDEVPPWLRDVEDQAKRDRNIAIGALVSGGILITGGVVAAVLNRPRAERRLAPPVTLSISPGGRGTTIGIAVRF